MSNPVECPTDHQDAYAEMCEQFARGVLQAYSDAQSITIMRDMPFGLQYNAVLTGAMVGGLVPLMLGRSRMTDAELIVALTGALPHAVQAARSLAAQVRSGSGQTILAKRS